MKLSGKVKKYMKNKKITGPFSERFISLLTYEWAE